MLVCGGGGGDAHLFMKILKHKSHVDGHNPAKPLSLQYHRLGLIEVDFYNLFGMDTITVLAMMGMCVCVCYMFVHGFTIISDLFSRFFSHPNHNTWKTSCC